MSPGNKCQKQLKLAEAFIGSCDSEVVEIDVRDPTDLSYVSNLVLFLCIVFILFCYRLVSYIWQVEEGRDMAADMIHYQIVALKSMTIFILEISNKG